MNSKLGFNVSCLQVDDSVKWNTLCKNDVSEISVVGNNDSVKFLSMLNNDFVISGLQLLLKDISEILFAFNKEINYFRVNILISKVFQRPPNHATLRRSMRISLLTTLPA